MSNTHDASETTTDAATDAQSDTSDPEELRTQIAVLREENKRLREEYTRSKQTSYRRTAAALSGVGTVAVLGGIVLPDVQEVLFVLGAIGIFGGVLTWYLTPERVLTVGISESIHTALAANGSTIRDELGLQSMEVYVPTPDGARLFIPQYQDFELPDMTEGLFHIERDAARGIALVPSGQLLVSEFERTQTAPPGDSLEATISQIGDALVEQFEIVDSVSLSESTGDERVVVSVDGVAFGSVANFDHPAVSVLACGLAHVQDEPITVSHIDETTVALEQVSSTRPESG